MIEKHPIRKILTDDRAKQIADKLFKESETKPKLEKVEVKPIAPPVATVTPLERFWAWLNAYADQQIVAGTRGEPVANPFAIFGILKNWQWIAGAIVLVGIVIWIVSC